MKKAGIITIYDNTNFGNRLQNYAVQEVLKKELNYTQVDTVAIVDEFSFVEQMKYKMRNYTDLHGFTNIKYSIQKMLGKKMDENSSKRYKRIQRFFTFTQNNTLPKIYFNTEKDLKKIKNKYDYFVIGSDQIWNPNFLKGRAVDYAYFADEKQKVCFSPSFGISELPQEKEMETKKYLEAIPNISVREDAGAKLVKKLTDKDAVVLIDPTMMLSAVQWDCVAKKPEMLSNDKFILNYFLGELSEERKNEINRIAEENGCEVIHILDPKSPYYECGPSEFLYLEKHAFLVCTDSFHSSVFAILYNRPFIVFNREDRIVNMNSRIETLINKFQLENREYKGKITEENINHDYSKAYQILEKEREKVIDFLKMSMEAEK